MMLDHHLFDHLVHGCSKLPGCEHIFKENHHLRYIKEGKLTSFVNVHSNDRCLSTDASHMAVRFSYRL